LTVTDSINGAPVVNYRKYVALISQTGINPPTATILENTLGDIVFSYVGVGIYDAVLTGQFLADKTWIVAGSADVNAGAGDFATLDIRRFDNDTIKLRTYDNFTGADDMLVNTSIEIRVYE